MSGGIDSPDQHPSPGDRDWEVPPGDTLRLLHDRETRRRRSGSRLAAHVRTLLPAAVAYLKGEPGAHRVWLYGSLASDRFRVDSDVDIAVEGLEPALQFRAIAHLSGLLRVPVDLLRWEDAPDSLKERILEEGVEQ